MSVERIVSSNEQAFTSKSVDYICHCVLDFQQNNHGDFIIGFSGTNGKVRRARAKDMFEGIARSGEFDWDRIRIFLVDERHGFSEADECNGHLVRDSIVKKLKSRGIEFSEDRFVFPDTSLDLEECRADYEKRLERLFKENNRSGPHLVTLGLGEDMSVASIFPEWYSGHPGRWEEATAKKVAVLCTETSKFEVPKRVCVNLRVIRMSDHIVLFLGAGRAELWTQFSQVFEGARGVMPAPPPTPRGARNMYMTSTLSHIDSLTNPGGFKPPTRLQRRDTPVDPEIPTSPLGYVLRYNHVVVVQLQKDEANHLTFVVVGAAGDLAKKKTFPSLFELHLGRVLPGHVRIVGVDNPAYHRDVNSTDELWNNRLRPYLQDQAPGVDVDVFRSMLEFKPVAFDNVDTVCKLNDYMLDLCGEHTKDNRIFYLALPPFLFEGAVASFKRHCWSKTGWVRVVVEKPFGKNLQTSRELTNGLAKHLEENQIYRIDHYLAKTMTLNILTLRFANREFGRLFHSDNVASVRVTFKEDISVQGRAGYFDGSGIIRDIMQNHLLQLLTLVTMEAPATLQAEDVRDEKVKVLKQIRPILPEDCVVGQYDGYQDDPDIIALNEKKGYKSKCATFAVCVMYLDNERWSGVPFILKAGKGLEKRSTIITVQFKSAPPHGLFGPQPQNELIMRVQPDEAIYYKILAKTPGLSSKAHEVRRTVLDVDLKKSFEAARFPEAYEKLIHDVIQGEGHNFVRKDEVEEGWRIFDHLLMYLESPDGPEPEPYAFGSRGPEAAHQLIDNAGFRRYTKAGAQGLSADDIT